MEIRTAIDKGRRLGSHTIQKGSGTGAEESLATNGAAGLSVGGVGLCHSSAISMLTMVESELSLSLCRLVLRAESMLKQVCSLYDLRSLGKELRTWVLKWARKFQNRSEL